MGGSCQGCTTNMVIRDINIEKRELRYLGRINSDDTKLALSQLKISKESMPMDSNPDKINKECIDFFYYYQ